MADISPESLEGRLLAQRKMLAWLLAAHPAGAPLWQYVEERTSFQDAEEDPGVEPSPEYAIEAAASEELAQIIEAARRHRDT